MDESKTHMKPPESVKVPDWDLVQLLTADETAKRLRVSVRTLEREIRSGNFPRPRKIGRSLRIPMADLICYINKLPFQELDWKGFPEEDEWHKSREITERWRKPLAERDDLTEAERVQIRQSTSRLKKESEAKAAEDERRIKAASWRVERGPSDPLPLP